VDTAHFTDQPSTDVTRVVRQGDNLLLDFISGDRLTVEGYFDTAPRRVDIFEFAVSAYTQGYTGLFVVDDGTDSALSRFISSAADAVVNDTELTLIGTLQGAASTVVSDYAFGV